MSRARRPAFVVTFSLASVAGCAKDAPVEHTHNPPALPEGGVSTAETAPTSAADTSAPPPVSAAPKAERSGIQNPSAQGGQVRLAADGTCFVYKPFGPLKPEEQRPPGTEPPRALVACPAGFATDPAYKACIAGVVIANASGECECGVGGNPPPPLRTVVCPR